MPLSPDADGVRLTLRVTPKASAERIGGVVEAPDDSADGARRLKLQVTAPPEGGKANAAVCRLLAKTLRVPKTSLCVISGAGERNKVVHVAGDDPAALADRIRDRLGL